MDSVVVQLMVGEVHILTLLSLTCTCKGMYEQITSESVLSYLCTLYRLPRCASLSEFVTTYDRYLCEPQRSLRVLGDKKYVRRVIELDRAGLYDEIRKGKTSIFLENRLSLMYAAACKSKNIIVSSLGDLIKFTPGESDDFLFTITCAILSNDVDIMREVHSKLPQSCLDEAKEDCWETISLAMWKPYRYGQCTDNYTNYELALGLFGVDKNHDRLYGYPEGDAGSTLARAPRLAERRRREHACARTVLQYSAVIWTILTI